MHCHLHTENARVCVGDYQLTLCRRADTFQETCFKCNEIDSQLAVPLNQEEHKAVICLAEQLGIRRNVLPGKLVTWFVSYINLLRLHPSFGESFKHENDGENPQTSRFSAVDDISKSNLFLYFQGVSLEHRGTTEASNLERAV